MFSSNSQTKYSLQNGVPASDSRMFGQAPLCTKRWCLASWSGMLGAIKNRRQTLAHIKWSFYTEAGASHSVEEISTGMKKTRFTKCGCLPQGWHRGPYGQTTKKPRFTKCGFFVFSSFLAAHRGDIEARMGKPRKNHVLQSVVFSFIPPSLLAAGVT